jgi:Subtilase family/Dockerin type I domain
MIKHFSIRALLAGVVLAQAPIVRAGGCPNEDDLFDDGIQVLLRAAPGTDINELRALVQHHFPAADVLDAIAGLDIYVFGPFDNEVDGDESDRADGAADVLCMHYGQECGNGSAAPLIWVEADYDTEACEGQTGSIYDSRPQLATVFRTQYASSLMSLPAAQALSTGRGVMVAVLDTGVDATHPALAGRVLAGRNFVLEADAAGQPRGSNDTRDIGNGVDTDGDGSADEMVGHGTYVAGLITLVAPDARILPVVVLDSDGRASSFDVAKGVWYAVDRGAKVINASLSSTYESQAVEDAVAEAYLRGVSVVGAAGNRGAATCQEWPAATEIDLDDVDAAISVGALDLSDVRGTFSNYDAGLTLSAPGVSMRRIDNPGEYDPQRSIISTLPGDTYGIWEGTSMATALVSGAAALAYAQNPQWQPTSTTALAVREALEDSAVNVDAANPTLPGAMGAGRCDAAALAALYPAQPAVGDLNGDGQVGLTDLSLLLQAFGSQSWTADIDGDGVVNLTDLSLLLVRFGT